DTAEALRAARVVAGHKDPRAFDNPSQIQATRRYLRDARRLLESSESAQEFYLEMLRLHPDRLDAGALWGAAITLFPSARPISCRECGSTQPRIRPRSALPSPAARQVGEAARGGFPDRSACSSALL